MHEITSAKALKSEKKTLNTPTYWASLYTEKENTSLHITIIVIIIITQSRRPPSDEWAYILFAFDIELPVNAKILE